MKSQIALAGICAALISLPAIAQTTSPPARATQPADQSGTTYQLKPGEWRASKMTGLNVYNSNAEKIGSIKELIVDKGGAMNAVVIGAGGFLGMGEHDVAVPFKDVKWTDQPNMPTNASATSTRPDASTIDRTYPDHAIVEMTKDQLKSLPEFKYTK